MKFLKFFWWINILFCISAYAGVWIPLPFDLKRGSLAQTNAEFISPVENYMEQCVRELFVQTILKAEDGRLHAIANNDDFNWRLMGRKRMVFLQTNIKYVNNAPLAPDIPTHETILKKYSIQSQLSDSDFLKFQHKQLPLDTTIFPKHNILLGYRSSQFYDSSSYVTISDRFTFQVRPRYENNSPHALIFKISGNVRLIHVLYENLISRSSDNVDNRYRGLYCELDQRVTHNIGESFYGVYDVIQGYNENNTIQIDGYTVRQSLDVEEGDYWFNSADVLDVIRARLTKDQAILNFSVYEGAERLVYPKAKNIPYEYKWPVIKDRSGKKIGERITQAIQMCDSEVRDLDVEDTNAFLFDLSKQVNMPYIGRVEEFKH